MEKTDKKLDILYCFKFTKLISTLCWGLALLFVTNVKANITTISDEETELYLADIIKPIFKVAGITFDRNKIFIVELCG